MRLRPLLIVPAIILALAGREVQAQGAAAYPNIDKPFIVAGDTVQLLLRYMNDGGPAMRRPGKRLDFAYSTAIPASNGEARGAQADRLAQQLGPQAVELGVRWLSVGICESRACAERKAPPANWYLYERTNNGWKRAP